ncbi:sterigmatocystin biosynthesis peroxidase-like protein 3 [Elsinoe australis]|uniref:Sterigmatocystin biosynthesis peroxidase-like protein 3 n=1 Tax=Elsinoe australis TaxID=40998 RepID=A0A4U7AWI4_9PEZI|nr:sterigmatocystin biosynthesis peroxidase-like protein 3 [Elsinoe australis]
MAPSSLLIAALAATASAFPGMAGTRVRLNLLPRRAAAAPAATPASSSFPAWHPPTSGEVRSPCPGLNALANHDICPRSGKGYTIPLLTSCLAAGLNMGADFSLFVGTAGIASNPNPLALYFDLDMLSRHNVVIEHDASLSRADVSTGDNRSFNQTIWNTVTAYFAGQANATIPTAAKAKYNRVTTEKARDPNFSYGPAQFIFSYGETAIYLSTMGDPTTGVAPVEYVKALFEEERLPYAEGWRKTQQPTTLASLGAMVLQLNAANGEIIPEGLILGEYSLKAALIGLNSVTGQIGNTALYARAQLTGALKALLG